MGVKQYWYNRATSNTFHLNALSLYSRLMLPNKRAKYMCSWKGAHLKRGVCWSIMKIVWHYSNCSEALYLYLPDNAMFTWLCTLWEQRLAGKNFLCGLNGLVKDKKKNRGHWLTESRPHFVIWLIWMKGGEKHRNKLVSAPIFHWECFHRSLIILSIFLLIPLQSSPCTIKKEKPFPFVLGVSLTALFTTTGEEIFGGAPEENQQRMK